MNISEKIQLLTQDASVVETAKANIKQAIIDKGVDLTGIPFTDYHTKIAEITGGGSGGDPQDPPTTGDYLVRFIDYDGTILKEEWVYSGENATPPDLPDYSVATNKRPALTFQEWNNSYTNITGNKDIGATYIPTDEKTHAYVRLTVVSGKDLSLYLNKTDTSTLSIDWGDNITTTHTNNGNFNTSHTYSDYGDYEIKIWISSGSGLYSFGNGDSSTVFVGGSLLTQKDMLMYLFVGNNVSSIGSNAFYSCYSLTSINIPANVSSIRISAFCYCYSLTNINLPANLSSIRISAFRYCYSLTSINLPANLSSIGDYAFSQCYSLTSINIPESVSSIASNAFSQCYSLTSINIPESVSSIASNAFTQCYSLTNINLPANLSSIGSNAFYYCYSLTSINIPNSVSSIGGNAFTQCYSLTNINLPANLSIIGNYAFQLCYSLTSISIPEGVSSIGSSAFSSCYSILKYVFNRTTPPSLANINAFLSINNITKIYVPDASVTAYKNATNWKTYADYIYPMSEMESD